jgi:hypothetical protein
MGDRFAHLKDATLAAALDGPARTTSELRRSVARGEAPAKLSALVGKIRRAPWTVTDADLDALRADHDEDELYEIIVAATLGAADERLAAALAALEKA